MAREKNNEQRQKILKTVYALFLEKGYNAITMKDIAKECNINVSLLQYYFYKKDDILVHIIFNIILSVSQFISDHFAEEIKNENEDAVYLNSALFYVLFYSLLEANDYQLLRLYIHVLAQAELIKSGIDFAEDALSCYPQTINTPEMRKKRQTIDYVISGYMTQFVLLYFERRNWETLDITVQKAIDTGLYAAGANTTVRKHTLELTNSLVTDDVKEKCQDNLSFYLDKFVACDWKGINHITQHL